MAVAWEPNVGVKKLFIERKGFMQLLLNVFSNSPFYFPVWARVDINIFTPS